MKIQNLKNKKIAVLGFGLEGQSTLRFLQKQGIEDITILDSNSDVETGLSQDRSRLGEGYLDSLGDFDLIFKSPGVSPFGEKLLPHRDKFISQTQVFFANYSGKVIGITGTKGKSTVSTLLYQCLATAGYKVKLVGNIGSPVLSEVDVSGQEKCDYIIYEMSSYMLQDFCPELYIGYINNIYPCHLDWHYNSMSIYKQAKLNILENAENKIVNSELQNDTLILNIPGKKIFFAQTGKYQYKNDHFLQDAKKILHHTDILLRGSHNMKNICGVMTLLDNILSDGSQVIDIMHRVLPVFSGLPHRIEELGIYEGIIFVDDAYASTPDSTLAAIHTFPSTLQTLFLGGQDSGFPYDALRQGILNSSIQNIIAFPDTSEKIFPEILLRDSESPFEIEISGKMFQFLKTRSMKAGVDFAYKTTFPGKVALLSCAAPSFSLWKNRDEKAKEFIDEVQGY